MIITITKTSILIICPFPRGLLLTYPLSPPPNMRKTIFTLVRHIAQFLNVNQNSCCILISKIEQTFYQSMIIFQRTLIMIARTREGQYSRLSDTRPQTPIAYCITNVTNSHQFLYLIYTQISAFLISKFDKYNILN